MVFSRVLGVAQFIAVCRRSKLVYSERVGIVEARIFVMRLTLKRRGDTRPSASFAHYHRLYPDGRSIRIPPACRQVLPLTKPSHHMPLSAQATMADGRLGDCNNAAGVLPPTIPHSHTSSLRCTSHPQRPPPRPILDVAEHLEIQRGAADADELAA